MFHHFIHDIADIQLPERFTYPFEYTPHPLCEIATQEVIATLQENAEWRGLQNEGKMFGVLIVRNETGEIGYLSAFSGNFNGKNFYEGFVPPVFDLLSRDGFFISEERHLDEINHQITRLEESADYIKAKHTLTDSIASKEKLIADYKREMTAAKLRRDTLRNSPHISDKDREELIHESQFMKAELRRIKASADSTIAEAKNDVEKLEAKIISLRKYRAEKSSKVQTRIFQSFILLNRLGERKNLLEIFRDTPQGIPPGGAGECAAPKMLQYAYLNGLTPIAMAEFWWGASPNGIIRHQGTFYPSCTSKCKPILRFMLQGIDIDPNPLAHNIDNGFEIVYEDSFLIAINKPSGVQSVRGKENEYSVESWLHTKYGKIYPVHRLDMATSGILLFAKDIISQRNIHAQFANGDVRKSYLAVLDGKPSTAIGRITLPLISDYENRPLQAVDFEKGKESITDYEVLQQSSTRTLVRFTPRTGRTHQLRVHSAHHDGLNAPILGDSLYGKNKGDRLYLHAERIEFTHPADGRPIIITIPTDFNRYL